MLSPEVDIANARIEFPGGAIANLTASRVSREKVRKVRVFEEDAYLSANFVTREVECFRKEAAPGTPMGARIVEEEVEVPEEEPLTRELRGFARAIAGGGPPLVDGAAGRDALALAVRILASIEQRSALAGRR